MSSDVFAVSPSGDPAAPGHRVGPGHLDRLGYAMYQKTFDDDGWSSWHSIGGDFR
jgi:hypothetical protein